MARKSLLVLSSTFLMVLIQGTVFGEPDTTIMVPMRDGVKLATDVYTPDAYQTSFATILIRTTYNKNEMKMVADSFVVNGGFAVVVQDTRGRFSSEGTDCMFMCDANDGSDTIAWIRTQAWSNGNIGSWGISALGITQYMVAPEAPEGLKAMWVDFATANLYDFAFTGGAFRQGDVEGWVEDQKSYFFLDMIKQHPLFDSVWEPVQTSDRYDKVEVPVMHTAGWYDMFLQNSLDAFKGYQETGGAGALGNQKLVIGPWTHVGYFSPKQGELNYPYASALSPITYLEDVIKWFRHYLNVEPDQKWIDKIPTVKYYTMGDVTDTSAEGNEWRTSKVWPPPATMVNYFLQEGGVLKAECPTIQAPSEYTYDPANPSPTICGGNLKLKAGPCNQADVEIRGDSAIFSMDISEQLEITGNVKAHLWTSIDQVDADLMVRMVDVYPDGRAMLINDSAARLAARGTKDSLRLLSPGEIMEAIVELPGTSIVINKGHKLRFIITSSNSKRFLASPNDGTNYGAASNPRPVKVSLYHEKGHPSYFELPVPGADPAKVVHCASSLGSGGCSVAGLEI